MVPGMSVPWITLLRRATDAEGYKPMIIGLATVDASGSPQVRSVVCRRVADDGSLWMTSDSRSAKNAQLTANSRGSAVYWAAASRQQFRFSGSVEIRASADDPERNRIWQDMNPETRATFYWPSPGSARAPESEFVVTGEGDLAPETFTVLVLETTTVEYLDVSVSPHLRRRWFKRSEWEGQDVNP